MLAVLGLLAAGCGSQIAQESESSPGQRLYRAKCQSCHRLPDPASRSGEEWATLLSEHATWEDLSAEQQQGILGYLQARQDSGGETGH